jgi:flagellar basal-body rod protein FlgF
LKELWVPLSGAIAQQRNIETIANNVANVNTPGFKKDNLTFREHLTRYNQTPDNIDLPRKEWSPKDFYHTEGAESASVKVDGSYIDFQQGQLTPTGNPLDLAINGPGFFEVLTPNGIRCMRRGNFALSPDMKIVTTEGHQLLAPAASPSKEGSTADKAPPQISDRFIQVNPKFPIYVSNKGEVFQNNVEVKKISLVNFKDVSSLRKEGGSLFYNSYEDNVGDASKAEVRQGHIEESNVNAVWEMSNLIKAHRHFESIQKAIKAFDEIAGQGINNIAKF